MRRSSVLSRVSKCAPKRLIGMATGVKEFLSKFTQSFSPNRPNWGYRK
jgi:hypothetical protein